LHTVSPAAISKLKESNTHDNYKPFKKLKTFIKKNKNNSKLKITKNLITGRMNNMPPPPQTFDFLFLARLCSVGLDTVNEGGGKMGPFSQSTYQPTAHSGII